MPLREWIDLIDCLRRKQSTRKATIPITTCISLIYVPYLLCGWKNVSSVKKDHALALNLFFSFIVESPLDITVVFYKLNILFAKYFTECVILQKTQGIVKQNIPL